jgi:hypothetical protein
MRSDRFLPLALITLGVVFLMGNLLPNASHGGLVVLGIGAVFLVGRLTTGRYGYAVPAGVLLGIGSYISLQDLLGPGPDVGNGGGWFLILLGLGFGLVYLIGMRPAAVWPLFPGAVLVALGVLQLAGSAVRTLAPFSWLAYWPALLVIAGAWLLLQRSRS